ncbi:MAG TPA: type II toxin-antitoxin system HicA family toxin [Phycisphaerae bacterium]|nr:type II toxin-antitoxin system HicA family toxin [Phycisphaerae bacterium]
MINALGRAGFVVVRSRGSHFRLRHADGRLTSVPVHAGEEIGNELLKAILKQCKMSVEELNRLL